MLFVFSFFILFNLAEARAIRLKRTTSEKILLEDWPLDKSLRHILGGSHPGGWSGQVVYKKAGLAGSKQRSSTNSASVPAAGFLP